MHNYGKTDLWLYHLAYDLSAGEAFQYNLAWNGFDQKDDITIFV